jgi:hypothetical protein
MNTGGSLSGATVYATIPLLDYVLGVKEKTVYPFEIRLTADFIPCGTHTAEARRASRSDLSHTSAPGSGYALTLSLARF